MGLNTMIAAAFIYILTNKPFGTLYVGMTIDLVRRIWEHKHQMRDGFSKWHALDRLVYYETFGSVEEAAQREKQLKEWQRKWKLRLIMETNPEWHDLYNDFVHSKLIDDMDPGLRRDVRI